MEIIESLLELGLTYNETKAYQILLERGNLSAAEVSKLSGVPYSRVYDVLSSLEQKGFIRVIPEKTKKFAPESPKQLNEVIEKKQASLLKFKEDVKKLQSMYDIKSKNPVIVGYGKPAFYKILKTMVKPKKFEYNIKWSSEYRPEWEAEYNEQVRKGMDNRVLCRYDKETAENIHKWIEAGRKKIKRFDNNGTVFSITDEETLITLIKANTTLLIRNKEFAEIMSRLFLAAYKNAEEIK